MEDNKKELASQINEALFKSRISLYQHLIDNVSPVEAEKITKSEMVTNLSKLIWDYKKDAIKRYVKPVVGYIPSDNQVDYQLELYVFTKEELQTLIKTVRNEQKER